jgi:hypothetical protein
MPLQPEDIMLHSIARLLPLAALLATPALAQVSVKGIGDTCLSDTLKDCKVTSAGFVAPYDAPRLAWQVQSGVDEYDGVAATVVVLEEKDGAWQVLTTNADGVWYQMPRLSEAEQTLFHVPGITAGTGAFNADLLFEYLPDEGAWRAVDLDSWTVEGKLPEGLGIWKGVDYSFGEYAWGDMRARTALWNDMDGNCCPTGGEAVIHFTLEDGKLVAGDVDYFPPEEGSAD